MQLPVKAHYATLAMLALAQEFDSRKLMTARAIAKEHSIPSQFLGQILQQLRSAGLIHSTRGSSGGFRLEQSPEKISIADIVDAVCSSGIGSGIAEDATPLNSVILGVWEELRIKQREVLENVTLENLLQQSTEPSPMFYI